MKSSSTWLQFIWYSSISSSATNC